MEEERLDRYLFQKFIMHVYFFTAQVGFFGTLPAVSFQEFIMPVYFFTAQVGFFGTF